MQIKKILIAMGVAGAFMVAQSAFAVTGMNEITGPDSENVNEWNIGSGSMPFYVDNEASVCENPMITVDAGNNDISNNTVVGDVMTGDVVGSLSFTHTLNNGSIVLPGIVQIGAIDLSNSITGPNSTNINTVNIGNGEAADPSITNTAMFSNNTALDVNTGNNSVGSNTEVGNISTGGIDISMTSNVTANKNASSVVIPSSIPVISGTFSNSTTGPGSTNLNTVNVSGTTDETVITNTSEISNNIEATLNTGNNSVSNNTVVGNVKTGSVKFNVNVSSNAN